MFHCLARVEADACDEQIRSLDVRELPETVYQSIEWQLRRCRRGRFRGCAATLPATMDAGPPARKDRRPDDRSLRHSRTAACGRQQRFLTFAESCLWKCACSRERRLTGSLRIHTFGKADLQPPWRMRQSASIWLV